MKILPFLITKSSNASFHLQENKDEYFYEFLHQHPEIQITLILSGEGNLIAGDYEGSYKPGDIFVFGSNMPHVFKSHPGCKVDQIEDRSRSIAIFFNWEVFGEHFWQMPEFQHIFLVGKSIQRGLKIEGNFNYRLRDAILDIVNKEGFDRILLLLRILNSITSMESFNFLSRREAFLKQSNDSTRLNKIYLFTMQNYQKQVALEEVAEIANLAVNSFCRFFKKSTQKSYFEFLNEVRIDNACKLLVREQAESIYNICFKVGFNDVANFNRHFKKLTGITPSEYKSLTKDIDNPAFAASA